MTAADDALEERIGPAVSAALRRLAESHDPVPSSPTGKHRHGPRRWMLGVAASLIVAAGVAALAVVVSRDPQPADPVQDQPAVSEPATTAVEPATTYRFSERVETDLVATIEPAPFDQISAMRLRDIRRDFLVGIEDQISLFILDEDDSVDVVATVADLAIPAAFFDEADTVDVNGVRLYVDPQTPSLGTALVVGTTTTRSIAINTVDRPELNTEPRWQELIAEVATYLGDTPLDQLPETERFIPLTARLADRVLVRYSDGAVEERAVEVAILTADTTLDDPEFDLVASQAGDTEPRTEHARQGTLRESGQPIYLEQISPNDIVFVTGPADATDTDFAAWIAGLRFIPETELGIDVEELGELYSGDVIAQADEDWGRWQLHEDSDETESCFSFGATIWPNIGAATSSGQCTPNDNDPNNIICVTPAENHYAGVYLGDSELGFDDPVIIAAESSVHTKPDGTEFTVFNLTTDGTNLIAAPITLDDERTQQCTP